MLEISKTNTANALPDNFRFFELVFEEINKSDNAENPINTAVTGFIAAISGNGCFNWLMLNCQPTKTNMPIKITIPLKYFDHRSSSC